MIAIRVRFAGGAWPIKRCDWGWLGLVGASWGWLGLWLGSVRAAGRTSGVFDERARAADARGTLDVVARRNETRPLAQTHRGRPRAIVVGPRGGAATELTGRGAGGGAVCEALQGAIAVGRSEQRPALARLWRSENLAVVVDLSPTSMATRQSKIRRSHHGRGQQSGGPISAGEAY